MMNSIFKHRSMPAHQVHASLAVLDADVFELTVSDLETRHPLKHVALFAHSRRAAIRQFAEYLAVHYPIRH